MRRARNLIPALFAATVPTALAAPPAAESVADSAATTSPASASLAFDIDNPPRSVFSDEWYALMLNKAKSGYMHNTMERVRQADGDVIRSKTRMKLTVGRDTSQISVTMDQSYTETLDGQPLTFEQRMQLGKMPSTTRGTIKDGKVKVSTSQFGLPMGSKTYTLPEGAIMGWGAYREQIKHGLTPGLKYRLNIYEPSISPSKLTRTEMEVFDREMVDLFGRKVEAYRTKQTVYMEGLLGGSGIDTITWMTDAGTAVKMQMSMPPIDIPFDVIACPKAVALSPNEPTELMIDTLVRVNRSIDADAAKRITYRLSAAEPGGERSLDDLPETAMQKVERKGDAVLLTLTRTSARKTTKDADNKTTRSDSAEIAKYLEATPELNYKDPEVAKLVKKAAGDEKDPRKLAARLTAFVHDYVQHKNLSVGFGTASEVARSKEGDCTEHGTLLAALGRGAGLPSRIVMGMVYADRFGDKTNVFVGHLWTQFHIDGQWVDYDSALGQTDVDPTHIALGLGSANSEGLADLVTSGWLNLPKLKIEVVEIK